MLNGPHRRGVFASLLSFVTGSNARSSFYDRTPRSSSRLHGDACSPVLLRFVPTRAHKSLLGVLRSHRRVLCAGLYTMLFLGIVALIFSALPGDSSSTASSPAAKHTSTTLSASIRTASDHTLLPQALFVDAAASEMGSEVKISEADARAARAAAAALIEESEERDETEQVPHAPLSSVPPESGGHKPTPDEEAPESEIDAGYRLVIHAGQHHHSHAQGTVPTMDSRVEHAEARQRKQAVMSVEATDLDQTNIDGSVPPPTSAAATSEPPHAAAAAPHTPAPAVSRPPAAHWTYSSPRTGPFNWGNLDPSYAACSSGHRQSPVDFKIVDPLRHPAAAALPSAVHTDPDLSHILFNYAPSNVTLIHHDNVTHIDSALNNGHTLQVNYESGSEIFVNHRRFDLVQFHFHSPSEHTLNGRHFDMEMHLVHSSHAHPGAALAVVGLWLEIPHGTISAIHDLRGQYSSLDDLSDDNTSGELRRLLHVGSNPFLEQLNWDHMPRDASAAPVLPLNEDSLNIFDILPFDQGYITYAGSLTTPPCSEIVTWLMLKSPISCSLAQRNAFQKIFGQNSRPTQLLHGRNVSQTVDQERVEIIASGISHDLFMVVMGALIIVSLLLVFGVIFLCTKTQHRMGRNIGFAAHGGGGYAPIISSGGGSQFQYQQLQQQPDPSPGYLGSGSGGAGGQGKGVYQAIDPLQDELENGNRYRAVAQANAHAQSGAGALSQQQQQQQQQAGSAELAAPRPIRPTAIAGGNVPSGQGYGSMV